MDIIELKIRNSSFINELVEVWESSVRETHLFLTENEIQEINKYVPEALRNIPTLIAAVDEKGMPSAFMGISGQSLEMLFISPNERGKGLGKKLIRHGIKNYSINKVSVNEQNPQAIWFYQRLGFKAFMRTETDSEGRPYPIIHMSL